MANRLSPGMLTAVLLLTSALLGAGGLLLGSRPLRPDALLSVLLHPNDAIDSILVWTLRLPRSLCAAACTRSSAGSGWRCPACCCRS